MVAGFGGLVVLALSGALGLYLVAGFGFWGGLVPVGMSCLLHFS